MEPLMSSQFLEYLGIWEDPEMPKRALRVSRQQILGMGRGLGFKLEASHLLDRHSTT
jgi:hypothetical protein